MTLKFLLVTGQLAGKLVEKYASLSHVEYHVYTLPVPVAALLTARAVAEHLKKAEPKGYDVILTPGFIYGDITLIEEVTGVPTFRGPRYAADLTGVLDSYEEVKLSKSVPACELLKEELKRRVLNELSLAEKNRDELLRKPGNMLVGSLPIGRDFPMRVVAEIADAPLLSDEQIIDRARYYARSGADVIDIGMIVGAGKAQDAKRAVETAKAAVNLPISIDTIDPSEARAAVEAGADLILSVEGGNAKEMAEFAREKAVVVIPTNHAEGYFPKDPLERSEAMKRNIETARSLGMNRILADLILDPVGAPGFVESIISFYEFKRGEPEIPLFCGVGNVVELLDADTPGVNALATGVASELGISVLLTTEVSDKCRGCVKELSRASKLMFLARKRASIPKDLGIDLLILKDKRFLEEPYDPAYIEDAEEIEKYEGKELRRDIKGCFKIMIDRYLGKIVVAHYPVDMKDKPDFFVSGEGAQEIYRTILKSNLVSELSHSAYLGYELGKAEIALSTGKGYTQDWKLFGEQD